MSARAGRQPVAVVSGAGSGIGREIARMLARRGWELALCGRRREPLDDVLAAAGAAGLVHPCDVRDPAEVSAFAASVATRWPAGVDAVVPAAGVAFVGPFDQTPVECFDAVIDTNLRGAFLLIRAFLTALGRRPRSWIVPIVSTAGARGFADWSAYCASKWGLAGMIAALRRELEGGPVRVTAIYPGAVDTPIWNELAGEWDRGRMIPAAEVARAVAFALDAPDGTAVEEVHLGPAGGAL